MGYKNICRCRACGGAILSDFYTFDNIPIAGIYYEEEMERLNERAPITLTHCSQCGLIQLRETIDSSIYLDYSFVGNSTVYYEHYLYEFAEKLVRVWNITNKRVFEVGASNGILLHHIKKIGNNCVEGIEPSQKLCLDAAKNGISIIQGFFNKEFVNGLQGIKYDCVIIRHVLEHIHKLQEMVSCLRCIIENDGILIVEVPDASAMLRKGMFSNVFHEHLNYFSLDSLNRLMRTEDFENIFMQCVDIHGGSIMAVYRLRRDKLPKCSVPLKRIPRLLDSFSQGAQKYYSDISSKVHDAIANKKIVHGYGASHRTFCLMGCSKLDVNDIPVIYDNNVFLQYKRMNGLGVLVLPPTSILDNNPDVIVIFATSYKDEIINLLRGKYNYQGEIISVKDGE